MKFTKHHQLLTVAGLFGMAALALAQPASSQSSSRADAIKDVRNAEAQVRQERQDLARARTREEREDALKDLRNAENRLATERQDLARFGVTNTGRPSYNRPDYNRPGYNRPVYNRPNYNRPGKPNNGWGYGRDKDRRDNNGRDKDRWDDNRGRQRGRH